MDWQKLQDYLEGYDTDGDVVVTTLLDRFPAFPEKRLKGYIRPSGEPTVEVSHLRDVIERYGDVDNDGNGGPTAAPVDNDDTGLQIAHNTTVPEETREYEGTMHIETDEDKFAFVEEALKRVGERYGSTISE